MRIRRVEGAYSRRKVGRPQEDVVRAIIDEVRSGGDRACSG